MMMQDAGKDTLKRSWDIIATRLKVELGDDLYSSWFARMEAEGCADGQLAVSVPTRFLRNWIQSHYSDRLLESGAHRVRYPRRRFDQGAHTRPANHDRPSSSSARRRRHAGE